VRIDRDGDASHPGLTSFGIEISLDGDLTQREKILLFNSARKCEVSKMLSGDFNFSYRLGEG
jgi:hypothetical protein